MVSKAADTAKTAAALGPWLISNREAGAWRVALVPLRDETEQQCPSQRSRRLSRPSKKTRRRECGIRLDGFDVLMPSDKVGAVGFCWGGRYVSRKLHAWARDRLTLPGPDPRPRGLARPRRCGHRQPPLYVSSLPVLSHRPLTWSPHVVPSHDPDAWPSLKLQTTP